MRRTNRIAPLPRRCGRPRPRFRLRDQRHPGILQRLQRVGRFLRNVRPVRHHGVAGFRLRLQHVSRIGADLRRHPGRSRRQRTPAAQPPVARPLVRQQRNRRSMETPRQTQQPVPQILYGRRGRTVRPRKRNHLPEYPARCGGQPLRRHRTLLALVALAGLGARYGGPLALRRRTQLGRLAQRRPHIGLQHPNRPFHVGIRAPILPRTLLGRAFHPRRGAPPRLSVHDVASGRPEKGRRPDAGICRPVIPARRRFRTHAVPQPIDAGRRDEDGDGGASAQHALLHGVAHLAAQRRMALRQLVGNRLLRPVESHALLCKESVRTGRRLPLHPRRYARHFRRLRPAEAAPGSNETHADGFFRQQAEKQLPPRDRRSRRIAACAPVRRTRLSGRCRPRQRGAGLRIPV